MTTNAAGRLTERKLMSSKTAACTAFFAAGISSVLIILLHLIEPEFEPSWRFVSEYAGGRFGFVMRVAFAAMSLSLIALAYALRAEVSSKPGLLGLGILGISGLGCGIAALFSMDPITSQPGPPTLSGKLHGVGSIMGIPTFPVAALLITYAVTRRPDWSSRRTRLRLLAHGTWISLVLMFILLSAWLSANYGRFGPEVPIGWLNRLVVALYLAWVIDMAASAAEIAEKRLSPEAAAA
jgi:hypothetical protein